MINLEEVAARLGLKVDKGEFAEGTSALSKLKTVAIAAGAAIAGAKIVDTLHSWHTELIAVGTATQNMADTFKLSAETLQGWEYGVKDAGGNGEALAATLRTLARSLQIAKLNGIDPAAIALRKLGVSAKQIKAQDLEGSFYAIADGLQKNKLGGVELASVMTILGDEATKLLPWLRKGADGIRDMSAEAVDLGEVMSNETIAGLKATGRQSERLGATFRVLKREISLSLMEPINDVQDGLLGVMRKISGPVAAGIRTAIGGITDGLRLVVRLIGFAVGQVWEWIDAIRSSEMIQTLWHDALDKIAALWQVFVAQLKSTIAVLRVSFALFGAVFKVVMRFVDTLSRLSGGFRAQHEAQKQSSRGLREFAEVIDWLTGKINAVADMIGDFGDAAVLAFDSVDAALHNAFDWLIDVLKEARDIVVGIYEKITSVGDIARGIASRIRHPFSGGQAPATSNAYTDGFAPPASVVNMGPWAGGGGTTTQTNHVQINTTAPAPEVAKEFDKQMSKLLRGVQNKRRR